MNADVDTATIARIVARVKAAMGTPIDEEQLATVLGNSLRQLKEENAEKYIDVINQLSGELERMAVEIGKLRANNA